ncbi:hypothetical protein BX616_002794 [Lobosporangium transversale]|nr:hypothetical protein BX616_002794 [Lobosporangium transversale]
MVTRTILKPSLLPQKTSLMFDNKQENEKGYSSFSTEPTTAIFGPEISPLYHHEDTSRSSSDFSVETTTIHDIPRIVVPAPSRRSELVQDTIDDGSLKEKLFDPSSQLSPYLTTTAHLQALPVSKVASTTCDSNSPQTLGPAWYGTFFSNSPDGVYPSQTRTCTWTLQAITNITNSDGSGNGESKGSVVPYVIAVNFTTPVQLICGMDYLTFYDGADTTAPVLAKLCGNIWQDRLPTIYSSGPQMTVVFSSREQSPGNHGFTAAYQSVAPCSICVPTLRGTCSSANTCNCYSQYSGAVCEEETAGFKDFTPRSQHAMVYDETKDMVYIMGGTSLNMRLMWDILTYNFSTNRWNRINALNRGPEARYGHFAFMYNGDLYIYGGVTNAGSLADIWKFNGKIWTKQEPINPDKLPTGRAGSACVVVANNNSTKLYVFGGLDFAGATTRELNVYDIDLAMWRKSDHQNSVGLSGATAVHHQATDSIYYFGGMINNTTRNVITYQYRISQDLWYALAPRIDPHTATPIINERWDGSRPGSQPSPSTNTSRDGRNSVRNIDDGSDIDSDRHETGWNSTLPYYLPPVMYDSVSTVWSPAGLMGTDLVVMYGGMLPYGPGVDKGHQSCFSRSFSVYDLSCQRWTTYDVSDLSAALKGRVNHTMIMRPPGSAGGSKTAWTAFIFGGFGGTDHADMLNITMNIPTLVPAMINNCRALRWCSLYDDCQNCNPSYCSYVNGLCLFDTDKTKNSAYLLGTSTDIPKYGTLQDLIRQRPEFKSQVLTTDMCPTRIPIDIGNPYSGTIQSGQEMTFKIYVDAHDSDIQFEFRTLPSSALDFKSLNVWEGHMNMYWRADHGLTDDTYNRSFSDTRVSTPPELPRDTFGSSQDNGALSDDEDTSTVITSMGYLNTSELMDRWMRYSGLDASPYASAKKSNQSLIYFRAMDPRRFSGYYVFSLTNRNPTALSFSALITLKKHTPTVEKQAGTPFNMATLGFFTLGFIVAVILLIFLVRKVRQLIEDRDLAHRVAEMQLLEDDEEHGGLNSGTAMAQMDGSLLKKPMYRVVIGVQDWGKDIPPISGAALKRRHIRNRKSSAVETGGDDNVVKKKTSDHMSHSLTELVAPQGVITVDGDTTNLEVQDDLMLEPYHYRRTRVRSDYIRDIGSAPLLLPPNKNDVIIDMDHSMLRSANSVSNPRRVSASASVALDLDQGLPSNISTKEKMPDRAMEQDKMLAQQNRSVSISSNRKRISLRGSEIGFEKEGSANSQVLTTTSANAITQQNSGSQRKWSLKHLSHGASFKRNNQKPSKNNDSDAEEHEGLTSPILMEEEESETARHISTSSRNSDNGCYDSEQEMVDLCVLPSHTDLFQVRQRLFEKLQVEQKQQARATATASAAQIHRRNPVKVQPLSIEPLPFHAGLVPRTSSNLRRYQRHLARQQRQQQQQQEQPFNKPLTDPGLTHHGARAWRDENNDDDRPSSSKPAKRLSNNTLRSFVNLSRTASRNRSITSVPSSQRLSSPIKQVYASRSQGSLKEVRKVASQITLRTNGGMLTKEDEEKNKDKDPSLSSLSSPELDSLISKQQIATTSPRHGWISRESGAEENMQSDIELRRLSGMKFDNDQPQLSSQQQEQQASFKPHKRQQKIKRKTIRMRGRQEYEPGPMLAMNYMIVFPGDAESRRVRQQGDYWKTKTTLPAERVNYEADNGKERSKEEHEEDSHDNALYNMERRLPPMAIGTVFVPDPVRWWAYKAKQVLVCKKFERRMRRMHRLQQKQKQKET